MDHTRKSQQLCSSAIYKNVSILIRLSESVQCRRGLYFEPMRYISAMEHVRMLIFSNFVLLACIDTIYKYCHPWMIFEM